MTWTVNEVAAPVTIMEAGHLFDAPPTEDGARDFLARTGHVMFIARDQEDRPIGFVSGVEMRHPDKEPEIFVYELGVDDEFRRQGVATSLLEALEHYAVDRGCSGLWTGTERDNEAALATYRSVGASIDDDSVFVTWDDLDAEDSRSA